MIDTANTDPAMTEAEKLLPCPFCGGKAWDAYEGPFDGSGVWPIVACRDCDAQTGGQVLKKTIAAERWNRRAAKPSDAAEPVAWQRRMVGASEWSNAIVFVVEPNDGGGIYESRPLYAAPTNSPEPKIVQVAEAALRYIDAIPKEIAAAFPAMPGFDRDWADDVIHAVYAAPPASPDVRAAVIEALNLAEDVLSRHPFSSEIWPNGTHPHSGIEKIRRAIRALAATDTTGGRHG